jgi:hypothetical protein
VPLYSVRLKNALCGKKLTVFGKKNGFREKKMLYDGTTGHLAAKPAI